MDLAGIDTIHITSSDWRMPLAYLCASDNLIYGNQMGIITPISLPGNPGETQRQKIYL